VARYALDKANATGWQHDLSRPIGDETAWFSHGDLLLERQGNVIHYVTSGGGSGLRYRVGRAPELAEDNPLATVRYITYEISSVAAAGRQDHFLMINGDIYWPSCREDK
jgi:NDP-sugar pyrophosphorylase family protein